MVEITPDHPSPKNTAKPFEGTAVSTPDIRSDGGTILLHWLTVASMLISLATGLRISADNYWAWASPTLNAVLPQGEIWTWHIVGSFMLFFCTIAYFVYVRRAALGARNSTKRLRTLRPPTTTKLRWRAVNVALHWFAYLAIAALTITGVLLYLGEGGIALTVHRALAWTMLVYILLHTFTHFLYGGLQQLLRLFRPDRLREPHTLRKWPVELALLSGLLAVGAAWAMDISVRPDITVRAVETPPKLDGRLDEPFWAQADTTIIATHQGEALGGTGQSTVTVRAVRSGNDIHFAFHWQDPTRSLMRSPTIKREDGWYVMSTRGGLADVMDYYEDKFAVIITQASGQGSTLGGGRSTFLGANPLPGFPKSPHGRGLHYTDDGRVLDLWQWKSSRGGMVGHVDDMHFGPPKTATAAQIAGKKRYSAGYSADPGKPIYEYNYVADGPKGYKGPVRLKMLPRDLAATVEKLGDVPETLDGPNAHQNTKGSQWWMLADEVVPYSKALDDRIPVGTIIPSTLNIHTYAGDRADLAGGARWENGYWTLEVTRELDTGNGFDVAFQPGQ
ncbi:MAG: ethylbenzene dehydrogenase-related protein, partial [Pseudomonadota bacterium]